MNHIQVMAFEYAVNFLNELSLKNNEKHPTFEIVWNTSIGLAKARTVDFLSDRPIICYKVESDDWQTVTSNISKKENDLFSYIRYEVAENFFSGPFKTNFGYLIYKPELLMSKLLKITESAIAANLTAPDYTTIYDFETLDGTIKLPFINGKTIEIKEPVSLVSKN